MALNIKNPEVERLADQLARLTGETKTEAIRQALLARRDRITSQDASAVVAILLREPGFEPLVAAIGEATAVGIGAPTLVESGIVVAARLGPGARDLAATMIREAEVEVIPFAEDHGIVALDAYLRYGKGRHRANLNFGDCLSYAVAVVAARPLLFVGEDFRHTDIRAAL